MIFSIFGCRFLSLTFFFFYFLNVGSINHHPIFFENIIPVFLEKYPKKVEKNNGELQLTEGKRASDIYKNASHEKTTSLKNLAG